MKHLPPLKRTPLFRGHHEPPLQEGQLEERTDSSGSDGMGFARPSGLRRGRTTTAMENGEVDLSSIPQPRLGDRTVSTAVRLRRQGFMASRSAGEFAVRSIRRGSDDWLGIIKPFVADLAFRSFVSRRYQSEVSFRPYTCRAAVLFVDLSQYSKITAAIADRGAHALSNIVNAYLSRILKIVHNYGGDVVKFAGDAVLVVWEGTEQELGMNMLCAAKCSMELQEEAGSHPVEGNSLVFHIHCGLCCGPLESEIFEAPTHNNMQRLYHSVGGESLYEISELVDFARAGEVCISASCLDLLGDLASYMEVKKAGSKTDAKILTEVRMGRDLSDAIDNHIETILSDRMLRRNKDVEEDFINPSVLRLLSHGGLSPTQISQMRNLCVLFIAMTSNGSSVNWLMEVQGVLDRNRCPIVQIIDDDKGVHVVAAINLYETVPETGVRGLETCHELVETQAGCAIGIAIGPTFCGVTGSSAVACRWDITGPPPVRAARLMQYALANELQVVVDESVYNDPMASTRLDLLNSAVELKGSEKPVAIYSLSKSTIDSAFRILETVHASVHNSVVEEIRRNLTGERTRSAVLVTGIPLSGKKIVCQRAAGLAGLVPFLHVCDEHGGLLQLARTMAVWFSCFDVDDVQYLADSVMDHLKKNHWSRAHDECIRLVDVAMEKGLRACFLVDRIQFLDEFSVSLLRECMHGRLRRLRRHSTSHSEASEHTEEDENGAARETGRICFLCVHTPLYNWKTAENLVEDITRSHKTFQIPIFELVEAQREELRGMFRELSDMEVEERWLDAYAESSGFCAGYFIERAAASRNLSGKLWAEGKQGLAVTSEELVLSIPPGLVRQSRLFPVTQVSADVAMRFHQIYDELPPMFQTFTKVLAIATKKCLCRLPRFIMWEVLNDLIAEGVEAGVLTIVLDEMEDMFLLKIDSENDEDVLSFRTPALADIALDVCTPVQVHAIRKALLGRLEPIKSLDFRVSLLMADLHHELGDDEEKMKTCWKMTYAAFKRESRGWPKRQVEKWMELIDDEIKAAGYSSADILDGGCYVARAPIPSVGNTLPLLKIYAAPVSYGPMGHSLSVISRNTFHEWCTFHPSGKEETAKLQMATCSAAARYVKEMEVVESLLSEYGVTVDSEHLRKERDMMGFFATPATCGADVQAKAETFLEEFVPLFVECRLQRLYKLISILRREEEPSFIQHGPEALRKAYTILRGSGRCEGSRCRQDASHHALMALATMEWKPKPVPEFLPILQYQTVARLRNKTLKRLSDTEVILFRHQQSADDLECFLVVTMRLFAEDPGKPPIYKSRSSSESEQSWTGD